MRLRTIKNFLEKNDGNFKLGQFGMDWVEIQLDEIEEHERVQHNTDDTFIGALSYEIGTLLEVMKPDAPCINFFKELHILCEEPSPARNTKLIKFWGENPPETPVINYNDGRN